MRSKKTAAKNFIDNNTRMFAGYPIYRQPDYEIDKKDFYLFYDIMISRSEQVIEWDGRYNKKFTIEKGCRVIIFTDWQYRAATGKTVNIVPVKKNHRLINGINTTHTPCGYCHCRTHRGYLSTALIKQHECLKKDCPFLDAFETHEFWREREKKRADKKAKRKGKIA